jgi:hypothetical protein
MVVAIGAVLNVAALVFEYRVEKTGAPGSWYPVAGVVHYRLVLT